MSIERTYYCEGPECQTHARTLSPPPYLPAGFLRVEEWRGHEVGEHHFCSWDCCIKFGAQIPPMETIAWDDVEPAE